MLCNSKKLSTEIATCVPDDPAERLMVAILVFIGISANYGDDQIVLSGLIRGVGIRGKGHSPKESFILQKCNKT